MRMGGQSRILVGSLLLVVLSAGHARADEPRAPREPRIMRETGEITTVIDAADDDDPFDMNLILGFVQRWHTGNIRRETGINQPGLSTGEFVARTENVATFSESTSLLNMGAQFGLYRDLALTFKLPLILSNTRELGDLAGSARNPQRLADPAGGQLFAVPFKSPTRSGLDYLGVGLDFAILNQARDTTKPSWVIGVEGRFSIGAPIHSCNDNPAQGTPKCPDPVFPSIDRDPGSSRGTTTVIAHSTFSRRYGQVEPYTG